MVGVLFGYGHMGRLHAAKLNAQGISFKVVDPPLGITPSGLPLAEVDFAIIATPTPTHADVALPLLAAGVPCLVEKPLAATLDEAEALARFPHLCVGHVERFNPTLRPLQGIRPRFFQAQRLAPFQQRGTDVDVIADLMIHDLDLALWMLGQDVREVRAIGVGVMTGSVDIVDVRLEIGDAVAHLSASRVSVRPTRTLRVVEEESGIYWSADLRNRTLHRVRWGARELEPEPVAVPALDAITEEQRAFFAAIRGEQAYVCDGTAGLATMKLAEEIRQRCEGHAISR